MESDDDMHDANDIESVDEDFYSDGDGYGYGDSAMDSDAGLADYDFLGNESDDAEELALRRSQKNYTVLKEEDIRQRQEDDITRISTVLSISREAACILLRRYNWSVNKVHEEWFADEERVRKIVGLLEKPIQLTNAKEVVCGICFDNCPLDSTVSAACGHPFCTTCWKG